MSDGERRERPVPPAQTPAPAAPAPAQEPPASAAEREAQWAGDHATGSRDMSAALGTHGEPAGWERARAGAPVALQRGRWADAAWSFLYGDDTRYGGRPADSQGVAEANRRMRGGELGPVHGPVINEPVWTWEVPLYFWFGGIAAGSSFVSLACDLSGDDRSAAIARKVALAAALPSPPLLIADLGRPGRFLNMLRIFKPRSPMNLGAWSLAAFSGLAAAAVGADVAGRRRVARAIGGANVLVGGYLGSYTGVLLATTAVPVWARSRAVLGPIFVCTAAATGAAATRLTLAAAGLPASHPTRAALGAVQAAAMVTELGLSTLNERRLGDVAQSLEHGRPGQLFRAGKWAVRAGLALQLLPGPLGPRARDVASCCHLAGGLAFRYAWVGAGRHSARDHRSVAAMARAAPGAGGARGGRSGPARLSSALREPLPGSTAAGRYAELVRRVSLRAERLLGRPAAVRGRGGTGGAPADGGRSAEPQTSA